MERLLKLDGRCATVRRKNGDGPLHIACMMGSVDIAALLLLDSRVQLDVNRGNVQKNTTALHLACTEGHADVVATLLAQATTLANVQDRDRNTPLALAASKGHLGVVKALLAHPGIDSDIPGKVGGRMECNRMELGCRCRCRCRCR